MIAVEQTAFERHSAKRLLLSLSAEDSHASLYGRQTVQTHRPVYIMRTVLQLVDSDLWFVVTPTWLGEGGVIRGDPVRFQTDDFVLD